MKQWTALHVVRTIHLFSRCVLFVDKNADWPKLFPPLNIFPTFRGVPTLIFTYVPNIAIGLHEEPANIYGEMREWAGSQGPLICHGIYYKSSFKIFAFFFLPFKYPWLRSHDFMYIFKSGKSVCVTICRSGYQCLIIWAILARRVTPPRHVYMANCHPGWQGYPTWQTGQPAWAGHPTYHVNVIKIK